MANRWGNSGNSGWLFFVSFKITADGDCSHEIKRCLLLGRKAMTNLDSILKSRDITLPTKVSLIKAMVFPVVMYWCESWTIKAECWRIDASELWCWRRLLRSLGLQGDPTSPSYRRSVLGVHWRDWCWSWNSNTLANWCEELTHLKTPWCWERLRAGGEGDDRGSDGWMASPTWWTWIWVGSGVGDGQGGLACCASWGHKRVGHDWVTELNWTQKCTQFKTFELFISGILHLIFLDQCWPWVTETTKSQTTSKWGLVYSEQFCLSSEVN